MNDKEYGVELELKTNKFKNSLKSIAKTVQDTTEKMKQNLSTGYNMDRGQAQSDIDKSMKMIEEYQNKITDFQRQFGNVTKAGPTPSGWTVNQKQIDQIEEYRNKIAGLNNSIKVTQQDLQTLNTSPLARLGALAGSIRDRITSAWQSIRNFGRDGKKDVDGVNSELKETVSLSDRIGTGMNNLGNTIQNGFDRGLKSVKRFALSLFGIHSIWRIVSNAASSYLAYDTELSNKIEGNWVALGAMLEPILTWITDMIRKIVGYINVFIKAFTGKDLVAKANKKITSSTKETTKSVKELNKELTDLDEITNLTFDEQNNDIDSGTDVPNNPLEGFDDVELNPAIVAFIENLANKLKNLWDWIVKNKDMLFELGKAALVAFTGWQIGKVVGKIAELIGFSGGSAGLWGLIGAFTALDIYLGITLYNTVIDLLDAVEEKKKAQQALGDQQVDAMDQYLSILQDQNADEEKKNKAIDAAAQTYEVFLRNLDKGVKYTDEQKKYMEDYAQAIEDVSGKEFRNTIKTTLDVSASSNTNNLFNKINLLGTSFTTKVSDIARSIQNYGGGRFATGTVAYKPTYGEFGEYSGASTNPEIVSPQNIMEETLYSALAKALPLVNNSGQQGDIILEINGREFARATYNDFEYESNRLGTNTNIRRY